VAVKRTKEIDLNGRVFRYTKIGRSLYSDFNKKSGYFIATPEKAFLDAVYLISLGRYAMDFASLDFSKLDSGRIIRMSRKYPAKTKKILGQYGYS
jgi:hypothetical protein